MAAPTRFERTTFPLGGGRSIQLSYGAASRRFSHGTRTVPVITLPTDAAPLGRTPVRRYTARPRGAVAQLGERRVRIAKVRGSIPLRSTTISTAPSGAVFFARRSGGHRPVTAIAVPFAAILVSPSPAAARAPVPAARGASPQRLGPVAACRAAPPASAARRARRRARRARRCARHRVLQASHRRLVAALRHRRRPVRRPRRPAAWPAPARSHRPACAGALGWRRDAPRSAVARGGGLRASEAASSLSRIQLRGRSCARACDVAPAQQAQQAPLRVAVEEAARCASTGAASARPVVVGGGDRARAVGLEPVAAAERVELRARARRASRTGGARRRRRTPAARATAGGAASPSGSRPSPARRR